MIVYILIMIAYIASIPLTKGDSSALYYLALFGLVLTFLIVCGRDAGLFKIRYRGYPWPLMTINALAGGGGATSWNSNNDLGSDWPKYVLLVAFIIIYSIFAHKRGWYKKA